MNSISDKFLKYFAVKGAPVLATFDGAICHKFEIMLNFAQDLIYPNNLDHNQVMGNLEEFEHNGFYSTN